MECRKVSHHELWAEARNNGMHEVRWGAHQGDVVDVVQQVGDAVSIFINKEIRVTTGGREGELVKIHSKPLVPCTGSLLHAIEGLLQAIDRRDQVQRGRWSQEAAGSRRCPKVHRGERHSWCQDVGSSTTTRRRCWGCHGSFVAYRGGGAPIKHKF